jgi:lysophospholipase L1-like esterase
LTEQEAEARVERALALERRDLQFIVRACGPKVPIFFALQLFSTLAKPNLTVEEQELFELYRQKDKTWSKVIEPYSVKYLPRYSKSLSQVCADLGVAYTDLNDLDFEGWCFLDHGHLTDHGYRLVAQHLARWMKNAR